MKNKKSVVLVVALIIYLIHILPLVVAYIYQQSNGGELALMRTGADYQIYLIQIKHSLLNGFPLLLPSHSVKKGASKIFAF